MSIDKLDYLDKTIRPGLVVAFARGDSKYSGMQYAEAPRIMNRPADIDIRHVTDCHITVRLREAEDAADGEDMTTALQKIESAIGYLIILHYRTNVKAIAMAKAVIS